MNIHIDHVEAEIKHLATEVFNITSAIKADLTSGTIKSAEVYASTILPQIDPLYNTVIGILNTAISTCDLIQKSDWTGVKSRLAMTVTEITAVKHGNKHGIGKYFEECQIVIRHLIGKE